MELAEEVVGGYPCLVGGRGEPLVILPGLSPDSGVGSRLTRGLHRAAAAQWARTHRVYYVNRRPGMRRGITMAEIGAELERVCREIAADPLDVLGISTGGSIAQQLAAEHPNVVRRLVLISTACRLGAEARASQRRVGARIRAGARREALAVLASELVPAGRLTLPVAALGWLCGPLAVSASDLATLATTVDAEDRFDLAGLPSVRAPTLLIAGERDRYYERELFRETAALIPNCRLELHPGAGHVSVMSSPEAHQQVLDFLAA